MPPYPSVQCVAHMLSHCMLAGRVGFVMVRQKANTNSGYVGPVIIIGEKSTDAAALEGLQRGGGRHPCTSLLFNCRTAPKSIPLNKASVGEEFPTTSLMRRRRSRQKRVKRDLSVKRIRPHCLVENLPWICTVNNAIQCKRCALSQGRTDIRPVYPNTSLTQSISQNSGWTG